MSQALIAFYYHFHYHQHYFLCHDILEEAWKENRYFTKEDSIVSLILCATACYHYRRGNLKGAYKSFKKALKVIDNQTAPNDIDLGLIKYDYQRLLKLQMSKVENKEQFTPVRIPLSQHMIDQIMMHYPDYTFTSRVVEDSYIKHHHLERDRTAVVQARKAALENKRLNY
ncbi:DUF309 domain-containing protein [Staphylococcus sp. SQ8-PEA]|uniref:DUF309 domain-containing protein n=1 Tax=Staphylococcus marylandisciuri TaxID=2981529 RepID=A0ABT2QNA3_9STAP|nr:DUF309 domain-containing protein [Staphylococcus marylandisciuri]MCU5745461.1 DUF309 domain-containing protein [Staphylococcus marylandisciuri]